MRVTESKLPRALEVLDSMAARRGPVTLTEDQFRVLVGRLSSQFVTGAMWATAPADGPDCQRLGLFVAATARDMLHHLGLTTQEIQPLLDQMLADLKQQGAMK